MKNEIDELSIEYQLNPTDLLQSSLVQKQVSLTANMIAKWLDNSREVVRNDRSEIA